MYESFKRVAAIHDLSGFGRCSLAVILPVLSVMGMQVVPVPTAVLSSHTGGLGEVVMHDLTDYLQPALAHYKRLALDFDCIYTGFLASSEQIDRCLEFFAAFPDALGVVDPVMGDHGRPYKTYTPDLCKRMGELVRAADVITPNVTEMAILLGENYPAGPMSSSELKSKLVRLSELGPRMVVITGVSTLTRRLCNVGYDRDHNAFWLVASDYVPVAYPGTGDIFASVLTGAILGGDSLPIAIERASRFVERVIKTTFSYGTDTRYGVMLERVLPSLYGHDITGSFEAL